MSNPRQFEADTSRLPNPSSPASMPDPPSIPAPNLLSLPLEIRLQIYTHLLLPNSALTIRSLFIRTNFRNTFMSQSPSNKLSTNLLLLCKQLTAEALPVLYSTPLFHCPCRIEQLASQIGAANFNLIKHLSVDADDLCGIAAAISSNGATALCYASLEELQTDGCRAISLTGSASKSDLQDALKVCKVAEQILAAHPILAVLGQKSAIWNGGADAVDESYARVKWRVVKSATALRADERALDLAGVMELVKGLLQRREIEEREEGGGVRTWVDRGGGYVQYPYLGT